MKMQTNPQTRNVKLETCGIDMQWNCIKKTGLDSDIYS